MTITSFLDPQLRLPITQVTQVLQTPPLRESIARSEKLKEVRGFEPTATTTTVVGTEPRENIFVYIPDSSSDLEE